MLSGVVIEVGLIAMLRALSVLPGFSLSWGILFMAFGALNMLYGNLLALRQTVVKRMLAYSSLSHIGYILLGLGIALYSGMELGAQGAFFHLFNHMLMKGLAFLSVGALIYGLFLQNDSHASLKITDLAGTAQKYPWVALALSIAVLGLGGLPPLGPLGLRRAIWAAVELPEQLESRAFELGGSDYCAPGQLVGDFIKGKPSEKLGEVEPSYKPGVKLGDLALSLPSFVIEAIREALPEFGKQIRGFDRDDAVLTGIETRTSSPVRITRDHHSLQSLNTQGLYPAGEGAGYAGGILSAGVDGIKVAEAVALDMVAKAGLPS